MLVPILDEVIAEAAEAGHAPGVHRHGASRPAERDGARARASRTSRSSRSSRIRSASALADRRRAVERRRQVPPRRVAGDRRRRSASNLRRVDAAEPEPSRGDRSGARGHGARGRHRRAQARRADVRSGRRAADPDSRRRGVPGPGRRRRDAEPAPARRLHDRRHDPHHRQQSDRLHDRLRRLVQHALCERPGARLQDPDRPRQRRRSGSVRRRGAARVRLPR